ncbi:MAG: hypothetical protein KAR06_11100 [Deltaproteobacteria bacterium]|nr:hypothetical protein [Deltaproteobacteria bacterium]
MTDSYTDEELAEIKEITERDWRTTNLRTVILRLFATIDDLKGIRPKTEVDILDEKIAELKKKIRAVQKACDHPEEHVSKTYRSSQGNYDKSQDRYWTWFFCTICKEQWTKEGSR